MKGKKCPYCGRRISYLTVFHEKKHGIYECSRCKKESKIKTDNKLLIAFLAVILIIILYVIFWFSSGLYTNPLGIIPPAVLLLIFYFCSPLFIRFVPLKRFLTYDDKKPETKEIKKEYKPEEYVFDRRVFDEIKNKRQSVSSVEEKIDRIIAEEEQYVPVIEDVSEAHTSSSQAPLKKIPRQYTPQPEPIYEEEDFKQYVPQKNKPNGSKYTANRKF